jgi:hypothetical protein
MEPEDIESVVSSIWGTSLNRTYLFGTLKKRSLKNE